MMKVGCQERAPVDMLMSIPPFKEMMNSIIEFSLPFHQLGWINFFWKQGPTSIMEHIVPKKEKTGQREGGWS